MVISEIKPCYEKEAQDAQHLTKILTELTNNVHQLVEAQRELGNIIRSHKCNSEIYSAQFNHADLNTILNKIHERLSALEAHQLTSIAASRARSILVEKIAKYAPLIITFLLTFVSVGSILAIKELRL